MKTKIEIAQELVVFLQNYNPNTKTLLPVEEKQKLKEFYVAEFKQIPNVGCDSCVLHYLHQINAWLEREIKNIPHPPAVEQTTDNKKRKGCTTCKKKKG